MHLFRSCERTRTFWTDLEDWLHLNKMLDKTINTDNLDAIGLTTATEHSIIGFCKLAAGYFIYTCKMKERSPSLRSFISNLQYYFDIEKEIWDKGFEQKWKLSVFLNVTNITVN